ncbi:hypothetical protein LRP67_19615 [Nocardioides sp. cx-169]|uniref:hypothetical protein n=1 Tax=Nocardioides sp. cx-169 TaxID=2899080 RepID=UPI001E4185EB|nr:hypothetical protein [Nocardioides sp. cx-169]MCD4536306.1 hypothetical protein [Nocardioides sp. cx-169]
MRFPLRRTVDAPAAADDAAPPPPRPPRGRPAAAYAGVLDGRHLWLAIDAAPGSLALRETDSGDVVSLRSEVDDDDPAYRSIRVDLAGLAGASYDAVLVPGSGGRARPVWISPLPHDSLVRTPVSEDGRYRWDLGRLDDGTLRLTRVEQPETVLLRRVGLAGDSFVLTTDPVPEPVLTLVGDTGSLLERPMSPTRDGLLEATLSLADLSLADLPPDVPAETRVLVGGLPVRRRRHDLSRPGIGVILPALFDGDREAARVRVTPDGLLGVWLDQRTGGAA